MSLQAPLDPLSAAARDVLKRNLATTYTQLVVGGNDPSGPDVAGELLTLTPQTVLAKPPVDADAAACVLAGLWLWHDFLDRAHKLVQNLSSPSAAFWHAIIHRREGDFWNSKYWFARCANHAVLPTLSANASAALNSYPADASIIKLTHRGWDADAFVDRVEEVNRQPDDPRHALCVQLQQLEWRLLFDHDLRQASGG